MRKTITFLFVLSVYSLFGQICTIDYSQTQVGLYPDTLPTGYVGQGYNTDVTFVMPLDTLGYDFTNFNILAVSLPVGLNWQCNNNTSNCDYNPQVSQYGCVNISGTPLLAGSYSIYVTVIADLTVVQGYPFTFQIYMEVLPSNVTTSNDGFSMTGAAGCSPITVDFTNNNPGLLAYSWDFGNGNISTLENPAPQVYTTPGDYAVHYAAYSNLDTVQVYTLSNVTVSSMTNYGEGFPSYETADTYIKILENGNSIFNSSITADQNPPVSFTTSIVLNPANTYVIQVYEADESNGDFLLGADDFMGNHTVMLSGCNGCAVSGGDSGSGATINYTVTNQTIYPTPTVISVDTVHVYGYPPNPVISYDSLSHTLSTQDLGYGYQWYFNGSPITAGTNVDYLVTNSGDYYIIAINQNGCVSFSDTLRAVYCSPNVNPVVSSDVNSDLIVDNVPVSFSIQWMLDGNPVAGAVDSTITVLASGAYSVEIADTFGCVYQSAPLNVGLGLNAIESVVWSVAPNPSDDFIQVKIDPSMKVEALAIHDLAGRSVKTWNWTGNDTMNIDIQDLPAGSYLLFLKSKYASWSRKIVIQ
jgi:hypothetical protein